MKQPVPIPELPFRWHAARYVNPQAKAPGLGNVGHLVMDEPYQLGGVEQTGWLYSLRAAGGGPRPPALAGG